MCLQEKLLFGVQKSPLDKVGQISTAQGHSEKTFQQWGHMWGCIEADLPLLELLGCEGNVLADDCSNEVVAVLW